MGGMSTVTSDRRKRKREEEGAEGGAAAAVPAGEEAAAAGEVGASPGAVPAGEEAAGEVGAACEGNSEGNSEGDSEGSSELGGLRASHSGEETRAILKELKEGITEENWTNGLPGWLITFINKVEPVAP